MHLANPSRWRRWIPPVLVAAMIWIASGRGEIASFDLIGYDKIGHFLVFGLLATLIVRNGFTWRTAWVPVLLASLYGGIDEWHQGMTPGRFVEVTDWVADTLGAAVAVVAYLGWKDYRDWLERPLGRRARKSRIEKSSGMTPNRDVA